MSKQELKEEFKQTEGNPEDQRKNPKSAEKPGKEPDDAGSSGCGCDHP